jgi:hypothetical protein
MIFPWEMVSPDRETFIVKFPVFGLDCSSSINIDKGAAMFPGN